MLDFAPLTLVEHRPFPEESRVESLATLPGRAGDDLVHAEDHFRRLRGAHQRLRTSESNERENQSRRAQSKQIGLSAMRAGRDMKYGEMGGRDGNRTGWRDG